VSFLQPLLLFALPAILVPIVIHLVHLRRQRIVEWGAMMFLLQGARMSRGLQRLRQWLLLALRTLAVLGLVLGIARPIAGGWIGGVGGARPDEVVVVLDRSPSMGLVVPGTGRSRLAQGVERLASALATVAPRRVSVFDGVGDVPLVLEGADDLAELATTHVTSATTDVPGLVEAAAAHLVRSGAGAAEIWIVSDAEASDWRPDDGRWPFLATELAAAPAGVRVRVLTADGAAGQDLAVRVPRAEVLRQREQTSLALDIEVRALGESPLDSTQVPVTITLGGVRSQLDVELVGGLGTVTGHQIDLAAETGAGFGSVTLPTDENPANDAAFFVFGDAARRETVIVAEDETVRDVLRAAAEAPLAAGREYVVRAVEPGAAESLGAAALELERASLCVWQAPLPTGDAAEALHAFVRGGGALLFLPSRVPHTSTEFAGASFGAFAPRAGDGRGEAPSEWRGSGDLLRRGADGTTLGVGGLEVKEWAEVRGDVTPLATFADGARLLARAPTATGGVYFLGTLPLSESSNLAIEGVTLVAIVHRALELGEAAALARTRLEAGRVSPERLGGARDAWRDALTTAGQDTVRTSRLLTERFHHAGVLTDGERFVALERGFGEDQRAPLAHDALTALLPGIDVTVVRETGAEESMLQEVWRMFLVLLVLALVAEALMCLGEARRGGAA
jgi:hypothetical protein